MSNTTQQSATWGHSQPHEQDHIIFSGSDTLTLAVKLDQMGIEYKKVFGCYKGQREISFITNAKHWNDITLLPELQDEESILHLGDHDARDRRKATLRYLIGVGSLGIWFTSEYIGQFRSTSKEIALQQDNYSFDPSGSGTYYIVEPKDAKGRLHT